jgi:hypothetical protein
MRSARPASTSVFVTPEASSERVFSPCRSTRTPRSSSSASIASTSRMRGTLCSTTGRSVSSAHASSGSAAFLFPAGSMVPESGTPPSMTNFSMGMGAEAARGRLG